MTDIRFSKDIYNDINNNSDFIKEAETFLNALIDDELEKENPDFDFIDECIDTIDIIRNGEITAETLLSKKEFINKITGKRNYKPLIGLVAAAAAIAVVFGGMQIGHSEEIIAKISRLTRNIPFFETVEPMTERSVASLKCSFTDEFKDEYIEGEAFDKSGIVVTAEYSDGTTENIPLSECNINYNESFGKNIGYETVTVEYMEVITEFKVRILFDESSVILNSIYAGFPEDVEIGKENLDKIQVYAVYSDGSERRLSADEYKITVESADETTDIVTIDYKNCSATFAIEKEVS